MDFFRWNYGFYSRKRGKVVGRRYLFGGGGCGGWSRGRGGEGSISRRKVMML